MTTANTKILDLDTLVPDKRVVVIGGKHFDASSIPLALAFKVMDVKDKLSSGNEGETLRVTIDILAAILGKDENGEEIDGAWLMEHVNVSQVQQLVAFLEDLFQFNEDGSVNPTLGQVESNHKTQDLSDSENS